MLVCMESNVEHYFGIIQQHARELIAGQISIDEFDVCVRINLTDLEDDTQKETAEHRDKQTAAAFGSMIEKVLKDRLNHRDVIDIIDIIVNEAKALPFDTADMQLSKRELKQIGLDPYVEKIQRDHNTDIIASNGLVVQNEDT